MPSFDEFLSAMEGERMNDLVQNAVSEQFVGPFNLSTDTGASEFAGIILELSLHLSVSLLGAYHEWISESLS